MIIDIGGDDRYESGNWSLGIGYWFGTGIVYDSEGDDIYRSVYFTQASGAHFCNEKPEGIRLLCRLDLDGLLKICDSLGEFGSLQAEESPI